MLSITTDTLTNKETKQMNEAELKEYVAFIEADRIREHEYFMFIKELTSSFTVYYISLTELGKIKRYSFHHEKSAIKMQQRMEYIFGILSWIVRKALSLRSLKT